MKMHLILTLAGLAISFALPTLAQEKDAAVDPRVVQQLHAMGKKSDEAFLKGDAAALAALYTGDAVYVTDTGPIRGRNAIENIMRTGSRKCVTSAMIQSTIQLLLIL